MGTTRISTLWNYSLGLGAQYGVGPYGDATDVLATDKRFQSWLTARIANCTRVPRKALSALVESMLASRSMSLASDRWRASSPPPSGSAAALPPSGALSAASADGRFVGDARSLRTYTASSSPSS
jgi:hypothetical protein